MNYTSGNRLVEDKVRSRSDRYHQQRLNEIRTSRTKETHLPHRPDNRKGAMLEEDRKEQIERDNAVLLSKLSRIMDKKSEAPVAHTVKSRRPKLLDELVHAIKPRTSAARSQYSQDKMMPSWMSHRLSMKSSTKAQHHNNTSGQSAGEPTPNNPAKEAYDSAMKYLNDAEEDSSLRENKDLQDRFNKPQELFERIVLYKKSCTYDDTSYLVEISAAYNKLIVLVFDMMNPKLTRRLVLSEKRTEKILAECDYDYAQLASWLVLNDEGVLFRKHVDTKCEPTQSQHSSQPRKAQYERQQKFLARNFYEESQKRKKAAQAFEEQLNHPPQSSAPTTSTNRINTFHEVKPATAISNIRRRFQFEIPDKERNKRKDKFGYTSYVIREEKTESDAKGDTVLSKERETPKHQFRASTQLSKATEKTASMQKPYINGFLKDKPQQQQKGAQRARPEQLQPAKKTVPLPERGGMPSIDSPLSPIRPKQEPPSGLEEGNDYEDNFEEDGKKEFFEAKQQKQEEGYADEYEADAEYPADKPQSRLRQQRNYPHKSADQESDGSSELRDPDAEGEQDNYAQYEDEQYPPASNNESEEAADNYQQEFQDHAEELQLTENRSKPQLANPSGTYEQDFELSESHV